MAPGQTNRLLEDLTARSITAGARAMPPPRLDSSGFRYDRMHAREKLRNVSPDSPRKMYFDLLHAAISEYYLADASNPYQQSGRSSGAQRWEQTRRCLVEAIHRSGNFMDVGCANGLLLETVIDWAAEAGFCLRPHGLDFVADLVALAQQRFPEHRHSFVRANAFYWTPARDYDFVRTNLEYVPRADWLEFIRRQYRAVSPGGRLIVCHYRNENDPVVDIASIVGSAGYKVAGRTEAPGVAIVWTERPNCSGGL